MNAFDRLKQMVAFESEPKLTPTEVEGLLEQYARKDKNGNSPSLAEWIPTYDLNGAAAEGWRLKMGKASELISVDLDGERMSSNQVFEHCERMSRMYSRRRNATVSTSAK